MHRFPSVLQRHCRETWKNWNRTQFPISCGPEDNSMGCFFDEAFWQSVFSVPGTVFSLHQVRSGDFPGWCSFLQKSIVLFVSEDSETISCASKRLCYDLAPRCRILNADRRFDRSDIDVYMSIFLRIIQDNTKFAFERSIRKNNLGSLC